MSRVKVLPTTICGWMLLICCHNVYAIGIPITVSVAPSSQAISLGSPADLAIEIAGLADPPSLGTFDLNLGFDPTILSFNSVNFGDAILGDQLDPTGGGNTITFVSSGTGTVELFDLSLDASTVLNTLQPSSFVLATLMFDTIGTGSSPLNLSVNALGDADGNSLQAILQNGTLDVTNASAVPEPTTLPILSSFVLLVLLVPRLGLFRQRIQP